MDCGLQARGQQVLVLPAFVADTCILCPVCCYILKLTPAAQANAAGNWLSLASCAGALTSVTQTSVLRHMDAMAATSPGKSPAHIATTECPVPYL